MSLSSMNAGHTSENGQISGGCASPCAVGPDRSWHSSSGTVRQRPAHGSGAGLRRNIAKLKASATSGSPTARCVSRILRTNRSGSPVASWPTLNGFSAGYARSWPGMSAGREQPPSQSECSI